MDNETIINDSFDEYSQMRDSGHVEVRGLMDNILGVKPVCGYCHEEDANDELEGVPICRYCLDAEDWEDEWDED